MLYVHAMRAPGREIMEVPLYSFLALALETSEYSACLNVSAACNRAPVTE